MSNELREAWDERHKADAAAIKEIADKIWGSTIEPPEEEAVKMPLPERAKMHGCYSAAQWKYDYNVFLEAIMEHTGLSLTDALLFQVLVQLKDLDRTARLPVRMVGPDQPQEPWEK